MKKIIFSALSIILILLLSGFIIYCKITPQIIVEQVLIYGRNLIITGRIEQIKEIKDLKVTIGDRTFDLDVFERNGYIVFENNNTEEDSIITLDNFDIGDYKISFVLNGKKYKLKHDLIESDFEYTSVTYEEKRKDYAISLDDRKIKVYESNASDVYDIIIDPGHSLDEEYFSTKDINEATTVLEIGLLVKDYLVEAGYKVGMTREDDSSPGNSIDPYGKGSRTGIPYELYAKYLFSIHLNSAYEDKESNGIEIYSYKKTDHKLAKYVAESIFHSAKTSYSKKTEQKIMDGVYIRNFTDEEIEMNKYSSVLSNYKAYESITTETPYHYIIRETGGIYSGAYVDGRNTTYNANPYRYSYYGAESYLLELGYITNKDDYNNLLKNYKDYARGIADGIINYLK